MRAAIFDFDGTLLAGNSWQLLFRDVFKRASMGDRLLLLRSAALRLSNLVSSVDLKNATLRCLARRNAAEFDRWATIFRTETIARRLRREGLTELSRRVGDGFTPVLATGAFDIVVEPLARDLGFNYIACTRTGREGARFAGCIAGLECRGADKLREVERLFRDQPIDWAGSCMYSDNGDDEPLFRRVGTGIFVGARRPRHLPRTIHRVEWLT
jgi:HAD superfamily phosphoserine phosphatase-like hydrolase